MCVMDRASVVLLLMTRPELLPQRRRPGGLNVLADGDVSASFHSLVLFIEFTGCKIFSN